MDKLPMTRKDKEARLPFAKIDILPGMPDTLGAARQIVGMMFDLEAGNEHARENFAMAVEYYDLGPIQITTCKSSPSICRRTAALIASTRIDHFIVDFYRNGSFDITIDGNRTTVPTRTLAIFDLTKTGMIENEGVDNLSLAVPRDFLVPLLEDPESLHGLSLQQDSEENIALVMHMEGLWQRLPEMTPEAAVEECQSLAAMLAAAIGAHSSRRQIARAHLRKNQFGAICRWIDENLSDPTLDLAAVTTKFHITRPTLYRMFEQRGGIMRYILQRRLENVFQDLISPALSQDRIGAIFYRWGLKEPTSANRAFRSYFGSTPKQIRAAPPSQMHSSRLASTETFRIQRMEHLGPLLERHKANVTVKAHQNHAPIENPGDA